MRCRELILNKQKIVAAQASSAYKHALQEVLESPGVVVQIKVCQNRLLDRLHTSIMRMSPAPPFCTPTASLEQVHGSPRRELAGR
jgi:hypothetical protein